MSDSSKSPDCAAMFRTIAMCRHHPPRCRRKTHWEISRCARVSPAAIGVANRVSRRAKITEPTTEASRAFPSLLGADARGKWRSSYASGRHSRRRCRPPRPQKSKQDKEPSRRHHPQKHQREQRKTDVDDSQVGRSMPPAIRRADPTWAWPRITAQRAKSRRGKSARKAPITAEGFQR